MNMHNAMDKTDRATKHNVSESDVQVDSEGKPVADSRNVLVQAMKTFIEKSFFDEESLRTLDRSSPQGQYKLYDYACADLYGQIDEMVAKCLLNGKMPAEESDMHEVMVEILNSAFECAVAIAGPRELFRKSLEAKCQKLVEIAISENKMQDRR